jgi:hypothetical protein
MTTENFDFKVNDLLVADTGFGINMGYYIETKASKQGIYVYYGTSKNKTRGIHTVPIEKVRLATSEEIAEFENK